jgi:hypothetical protein
MSVANQCPNCGGYKTDAESIKGDGMVEIPYINRFTWLNNFSLGFFIYIGLVIGMFFIFANVSYSNSLVIFIFGFPLLFAIVIPIIYVSYQKLGESLSTPRATEVEFTSAFRH